MMKSPVYHTTLLLLAGLVIALSLPGMVLAQLTDPSDSITGQRGAMQIYKYDARSSALAGANIAEAVDVSAINLNPAALSFVRNPNALQMTMHQNWNNNMMMQNFTLPAMMNYSHSFATQFGLHHSGARATNPGSGAWPTPDLSMYQADFAYAWSFENILSVGVFNNISFARNENARFWTYFANIGVMYAPSRTISYGLTLKGLGRSITYEILEGGRTILGSQALRQSLELGTTLHFPVDSDERYMSLSISNEKRFGENGMWYKGGLELKPTSVLSLRTGILFHPDIRPIPRFGFGLGGDVFSLDYTFSYRRVVDHQFHQLGLTLQF